MSSREKIVAGLMPALLFAALVVVLFRTAWLGDDAYITFRTIDNFLNGYGLRWNVAERVQTYTHPLWMFVLAGPILVTREFYFTSLAVSLFISLCAVGLLVYRIVPNARAGASALVLLMVSKAFTDYATSGLENPLSYLLVVVFYCVWLREPRDARRLIVLSLLASLLALNRLDLLVLVLPALIMALREISWKQSVSLVALGFLPLVLWEIFSLFYYGSLFPNTAHAKAFSNSLTRVEAWKNGLYYGWSSLRIDPVTLVTISMALVAALLGWFKRDRALLVGVVLYLGYTVWVGGDFMNGRFFAVPFFLTVCILARNITLSRPVTLCLCGVLVVGSLLLPASPLRAGADYGHQEVWVSRPHLFREHVLDERGVYYPYTGLLKVWRNGGGPILGWYEAGTEPPTEPMVMVAGRVGLPGFMGGPALHIVDRLALTDPLLARLPAKRPQGSSLEVIGHYERSIPAGYLDTLCTGENRLEDPGIAALYESIRTITRGSLLSPARIREIVLLGLGRYNSGIDAKAWRRGEGIAVESISHCIPETEIDPG